MLQHNNLGCVDINHIIKLNCIHEINLFYFVIYLRIYANIKTSDCERIVILIVEKDYEDSAKKIRQNKIVNNAYLLQERRNSKIFVFK